MTIDEELNLLDEAMRRLKVEYDVFFGGGSKKPPADADWRVQSLLKKFSDTQKLSFSQRFKYNSIAQRYAVFSEVWRQKMRVREEGYRRPADELLAVQGVRTEQERRAARELNQKSDSAPHDFVIACADVETEQDKIRHLFEAMVNAKRWAGETPNAQFDGFLAFIKLKTEQIQRDFHCRDVEYRVELRDGKVRLKAKAKS